ncbi:MAG: FAD-dependent monooxygenase [Isosphaeraceae bacterium]
MTADDRPVGTGQKVLIVGAGPTGLVLALWLTRLGIPVRIIDRTEKPGTTSRALAVSARTLEFYRQLDLAEPLLQGGVRVPAFNLWADGSRIARAPLGVIGEDLTPYPFALIFPQDEHERVLVDALASLGVNVERRTELLRFEQRPEGVRATIRRADGAEEDVDTPYLAGCDGARSTVREALGVGFPGGTYSGVFFVADVNGSGPATNGEIHVDLTKSDFLAVFPLKGEGRVRLVGRVDEPAGEGNAPGAVTFEDVRARVTAHLGFTIGTVNWFSTYHVHHRVASHFREGRVFLLGDAAHVHSPVGGQGMNTGIGDAVNLSWKLAAVLRGESGPLLLETYEPERIAFARRLVSTTDRLFTLVSARGRFARFVRTRVFPYAASGLFRFSAWRRFLFCTLSQLIVRYPESP